MSETETQELDLDKPVVLRVDPTNESRARYHRPDCGYVQNAPRTRQLRLGEVRIRPYPPCSKCKPDTPETSR